MAVVLADRQLTAHVRKHPQARDAHGTPVASAADLPADQRGPYPGAAHENPEGGWNLRVDPRAWRLREGDKITDDQSNTWIVTGAPKLVQVPGDDSVDFVRVSATLEPPLVP